MNKNENLTRRNRLVGFDYANPGFYLVTACTLGRLHHFGSVDSGLVHLSPIGRTVDDVLHEIFEPASTAILESYVIMPNHIHVLIYLSLENELQTVSSLMKKLKGVSTARVRKHGLLPDGARTIWQKGFHDQIVRNDTHLDQIREYITDNPRKWSEDEYF